MLYIIPTGLVLKNVNSGVYVICYPCWSFIAIYKLKKNKKKTANCKSSRQLQAFLNIKFSSWLFCIQGQHNKMPCFPSPWEQPGSEGGQLLLLINQWHSFFNFDEPLKGSCVNNWCFKWLKGELNEATKHFGSLVEIWTYKCDRIYSFPIVCAFCKWLMAMIAVLKICRWMIKCEGPAASALPDFGVTISRRWTFLQNWLMSSGISNNAT